MKPLKVIHIALTYNPSCMLVEIVQYCLDQIRLVYLAYPPRDLRSVFFHIGIRKKYKTKEQEVPILISHQGAVLPP